MLLNESVSLEKENEVIWLSGVDDAHFYDCHNFDKTLDNIPESNRFVVMLSHTPETYKEAWVSGVDYILAGHTHGGQLCLPNGAPIITNTNCPRSFTSGPWQYKSMKGYTSRGIGTSCLPVRFFCPPEVTIHELNGNNKA